MEALRRERAKRAEVGRAEAHAERHAPANALRLARRAPTLSRDDTRPRLDYGAVEEAAGER